jgi:hypothetical protein
MPDSVRVREDGRLFATVDKEQVRYLLNAYPTMDGNTSPRATEEDASLTLRYPTMK